MFSLPAVWRRRGSRLLRSMENSLTRPDAEQKYPEKKTEQHHADADHAARTELERDAAACFFLNFRGAAFAPGHAALRRNSDLCLLRQLTNSARWEQDFYQGGLRARRLNKVETACLRLRSDNFLLLQQRWLMSKKYSATA
jgi:hypothetical protein